MIIADACCNHLGDRRIIKRMIELCPADYIKFQLYDINELSDEWKKDKEYYQSCMLDDDDIAFIEAECEKKGIKSLYTLFSHSQICRAKRLGIQNVKVASPNSGMNVHTDMSYGFPRCIISTGMSTSAEIAQMLREYPKAVILACISRYPAIWGENEKEKALTLDGISDHSKDLSASLWAVRQGLWVERHYTLGKDLPGKDHHISSLPEEFDAIIRERNYLNNIDKYRRRWNG